MALLHYKDVTRMAQNRKKGGKKHLEFLCANHCLHRLPLKAKKKKKKKTKTKVLEVFDEFF